MLALTSYANSTHPEIQAGYAIIQALPLQNQPSVYKANAPYGILFTSVKRLNVNIINLMGPKISLFTVSFTIFIVNAH